MRAVAARQTAINNLQDQLRNNKVPLSIRSALSTGLQHLGKTHPQPNAQNASSMQQFISHQNTVGWYSLLRGYIPSVLFDSTYHHPKASRKKWVAKIISTLYTYHLHIWTTRNNITHPDSAPTFQTTTQHTNLLSAVLSWYSRQDELTPAGRTLLPPDPHSLTFLHTSTLAELNHQLNSYHALWSRQPSSTQDIRKFFHPLTTPTRTLHTINSPT